MNRKAIQAYNAEIKKQTRERVQEILSHNKMSYDFTVDDNGYIEITIINGDWKHDHIRLKNMMAKNGYIYFGFKEFGEDTGGDWYSAIHKFR
jgi:hypothetical protein